MARLNPDGTLDGPFNPTPNSTVNAILPLSTGQILVGGGFTELYAQRIHGGLTE